MKYIIRELSDDEFLPIFKQYSAGVFADVHSFNYQDVLSKTELEQIETLRPYLGKSYRLNLAAFDENNQLAGWCWGQQENSSTFYMVNSAVLKEHRRQGLYGQLMKKCIELVSQKGFQLIYSRHCATNNDIIIPKLKAGFIISKMEIDDRFGTLIHLHYYTSPLRRKIMDYRAGQLKPDAEIKKVFGM